MKLQFLFLQEEVAALNLNKFKKLQQEMEGAIERADMAENTLGLLRARNNSRCSSVAPDGAIALMRGARSARASSEVNY